MIHFNRLSCVRCSQHKHIFHMQVLQQMTLGKVFSIPPPGLALVQGVPQYQQRLDPEDRA